MTTEKQRRANIENAKKSTGPSTAAGLQKSKLNGLRHGLCAEQTILPDENKGIFEELRSSIHAEYNPTSAAQIFCEEKMLLSIWRSRRCGKLDALAYADIGINALIKLSRYESTREMKKWTPPRPHSCPQHPKSQRRNLRRSAIACCPA